jgi:hypothetical protein
MRWLFLFASLGLVGAGCGKSISRSHEGQFCSSFSDDDPYFECSRSSDLICINTYEKSYAQPNNQPDKVVAMWLCREACDPTAKAPCAAADEVCCPGAIFGRDYPAKRAGNPMPYACTPRPFCDAVLGMTPPKDAGAKDASSNDTAATPDGTASPDANADAGAQDAPVDL